MASTLPDVVQRLVTLRDLHEQGEGLEGPLGTVAWCEREHSEWGGTAPPPSPELSPPSQPHSSGRSSCTWTPRSRRSLGLSRTTACCWRRWVPATAGGVKWGPHPAPPCSPPSPLPPPAPEDNEGEPGHRRGELCGDRRPHQAAAEVRAPCRPPAPGIPASPLGPATPWESLPAPAGTSPCLYIPWRGPPHPSLPTSRGVSLGPPDSPQ